MKYAVLLFLGIIASNIVGCTPENSDEAIHQSEASVPIETQIEQRSVSWKKDRAPEDFYWLMAHAVPGGTSEQDVLRILGPPVRTEQGYATRWIYIEVGESPKLSQSPSLYFDDAKELVSLGVGFDFKSEWKLGDNRPALDEMLTTPETVIQVLCLQLVQLLSQENAAKDPLVQWRKQCDSEKGILKLSNERVCFSRSSGKECMKQIKGYLTEEEILTLPCRYGSFQSLDTDSDCWGIFFDNGLCGGPHYYLDVATGKLMLAYTPPGE